jgi:hypothetical protein
MAERTPEAQLATFLSAYSPEVRAVAEAALTKMRALMRGAVELVYDNYNALAIAFAPSERRADVVFSITLYPRWVSLFFARGATLSDPQKLLQGSGSTVRHIVLEDASVLDRPPVRALMAQALRGAAKSDHRAGRRVIIKLVAKTRRPRRPAAAPRRISGAARASASPPRARSRRRP